MTRRRLLELFAMSTAATGCEAVVVNVTNKQQVQDGIEPISEIGQFYVYQCCDQPEFDVEAWELAVRVQGEVVAVITPDTLASLEAVEIEYTLQCIGGNPRNPLINNAVWGGLPFLEVLETLGVDVPDATIDVKFEGMDDYHTSVPVEDLFASRLWLVWEMNGEPLPFEHGAPARFLCQNRYGTKNVKWPRDVDLIDEEYRGYWERTGWSDEATYRQNGFILQPVDGTIVNGQTIELFGTAYAGSDPISRVEITFDDGATWEDVEIYYSPGSDIWTLWRYALVGAEGNVTARVRVTTESGRTSNGSEGTGQAEGYDGGMEIRFEVRP
jgi:DMSO/TMAO reductase YedYZ molybdopterin-dependent catalytic subunit